jgi:hypothetical protein
MGMIGAPELLVAAVVGLVGLAVPITTIALLVVIYRKLSDVQAELRRLKGAGPG